MPPKKSRTNPLVFSVARLWGGAEGTTEKYELDLAPQFDQGDFEAVSNLTGRLLLIKMKGLISVVATDLKLTVKFTCPRCLKVFKQEIIIPSCEREFHSEKRREDKIYDIFYIDMKEQEIDLTEMLRQEIILHFPLIALCSERCRGLCPVCGKDKNKGICKCKTEDPGTYKPFKNLKKLIKK